MSDIFYGMIAKATLGDALSCFLSRDQGNWFTVIRSIDSARTKTDLMQTLGHHSIRFTIEEENVCLSSEELKRALGSGVFTGFDEVWLLPVATPLVDLARLPALTSDANDLSETVPEAILVAVRRLNCLLAAGDGCGLNYVTAAERIADDIKKKEGE